MEHLHKSIYQPVPSSFSKTNPSLSSTRPALHISCPFPVLHISGPFPVLHISCSFSSSTYLMSFFQFYIFHVHFPALHISCPFSSSTYFMSFFQFYIFHALFQFYIFHVHFPVLHISCPFSSSTYFMSIFQFYIFHVHFPVLHILCPFSSSTYFMSFFPPIATSPSFLTYLRSSSNHVKFEPFSYFPLILCNVFILPQSTINPSAKKCPIHSKSKVTCSTLLHYHYRNTFKPRKTTISPTFHGYRCELGIVIFADRVT